MLSVKQIAAFADELQKIATIKVALMPPPNVNQATTSTAITAPPTVALGFPKPKTVKPNLSKANAYAKPVNVPATSPAAGVQPVSNPPSVMS